MFACTALDEAENEADQQQQQQQEEELINKVLAEGLKLKRRCKELSSALSRMEAARKDDQTKYEHAMREFSVQTEREISQLQTTYAVDLAGIRDLQVRRAYWEY